MTKHRNVIQTGIAWYKLEQWDRLVEFSENSDDLEKTYTEWEAQAEEEMKAMRSRGLITEKALSGHSLNKN